MVTKLFCDETSDFRARQGRQAKRGEAYYKYGETLFALPDEVVAENLTLQ